MAMVGLWGSEAGALTDDDDDDGSWPACEFMEVAAVEVRVMVVGVELVEDEVYLSRLLSARSSSSRSAPALSLRRAKEDSGTSLEDTARPKLPTDRSSIELVPPRRDFGAIR